jgi:hypothetical protein
VARTIVTGWWASARRSSISCAPSCWSAAWPSRKGGASFQKRLAEMMAQEGEDGLSPRLRLLIEHAGAVGRDRPADSRL